MKHYNNDQPLETLLVQRIRAFFMFKWDNDRSQFIQNKVDAKILDQLPNEYQDKLFTSFLFKNFIQNFGSTYFKFLKEDTNLGMHVNSKIYSWDD